MFSPVIMSIMNNEYLTPFVKSTDLLLIFSIFEVLSKYAQSSYLLKLFHLRSNGVICIFLICHVLCLERIKLCLSVCLSKHLVFHDISVKNSFNRKSAFRYES